jgi:hypothetical protein
MKLLSRPPTDYLHHITVNGILLMFTVGFGYQYSEFNPLLKARIIFTTAFRTLTETPYRLTEFYNASW